MKKTVTAKKAIIMGATSGLGREVALLLLREGWTLGLAGRRADRLEALRQLAPDRVFTATIDVRQEGADGQLEQLIARMGGMDLYLHSSGIGRQNAALAADVETETLETNGTGFVRMVTAAYRHFRRQGYGHLAVISSIAGTKGLGAAPAYSATKRMQNTYIDALEQLAHLEHLPLVFTDIRPGFVATDLLNNGRHYPLLMRPETVARHIVRALRRQRRVAVIDVRYRLLVTLWRLIPRWLWKRLPVQN